MYFYVSTHAKSNGIITSLETCLFKIGTFYMLMRIVPKSLVALISMIMDGPNIKKKDTDEVRQATLVLRNC